jgi:hypothetical protein
MSPELFSCYHDRMETYGYMEDSELNLAEEVRQKYRINDEDIQKLIELTAVLTNAERACGILMKQLQDTYHLSDKHRDQLASNINTLCYFPHRAVTDAVSADDTHGTHPVHESIIFKALQKHSLLPEGRPAYERPLPDLREALAELVNIRKPKRRKAS